MKVAMWDIETSDLQVNFGIMLVGGVQKLGSRRPFIVAKNKIGTDDRIVVAKLIEEMEHYDLLVSYNGIKFDLKWLNSKALYHGLRPLSPKFHLDMLPVAKRVFRTHSKRLDVVADYLGYSGKTSLRPEVWQKATHEADPTSMRYIIDHNKKDLIALEFVYLRLMPFVKTISVRQA